MSTSKRPNPHTLPPDFRSREAESLLRNNRIEVQLNDLEMAALKRYLSMLPGKKRSALCREAIMEKVLEGLSENQPTLF